MTYTRVSLVVPEEQVLLVMEILLTAQALLAQDGVACTLDVKHGVRPNKGETADPPIAGGTIDTSTSAVAEGERELPAVAHPVRVAGNTDEGVAAPVPAKPRNKVLYRVINPRIRVGQVPHEIRMCLLSRGPQTAKQIEEATGRGGKSVESAVWLLRKQGSVEAVPDTGETVTQRKFSMRDIRLGEPVV